MRYQIIINKMSVHSDKLHNFSFNHTGCLILLSDLKHTKIKYKKI